MAVARAAAPAAGITPPVAVPAPSALTPMLRVLIGLAAAVVILAGMSLGASLIGPLAIAAVIVIVCNPVRIPLERRGWPSWVVTTAVIVLSWSVLIVLALMLGYAGSRFASLIVDYYDEMYDGITRIMTSLTELGLDGQVADAAAAIFSPTAILQVITQLSGNVLSLFSALFFIFGYAIFMAADAGRFGRAEELYGPSAGASTRRVASFNTGVRRYFVVNTIFGVIVAVVDGAALWLLGVPGAAVWAILSFVTNFIPNIGFILGLIPPALLALLVGGWPLMLGVVAIYIVANVTLQVLVQPKFVSDAVNLSLTLSFFSVLFWSFIIGPVGAILSIPLTLLVRALVLEVDPNTRWLRWLSGDDAAAPEASGDPAPASPTLETSAP
ncbi:MAG TPA: AI-2E family transporter [Arachnia sp.]|nr:AI-2E family transporter [Arachnia sp.]HMT86622.1 AI-2E family transporter [Arachnia sp.]